MRESFGLGEPLEYVFFYSRAVELSCASDVRNNRCRNRSRGSVDLSVRIGVTVSASPYKIVLVVVCTINVVYVVSLVLSAVRRDAK